MTNKHTNRILKNDSNPGYGSSKVNRLLDSNLEGNYSYPPLNINNRNAASWDSRKKLFFNFISTRNITSNIMVKGGVVEFLLKFD